jgi:hypothetical protein
MPKIAKTNIGQKLFKDHEFLKEGMPNLDTTYTTKGYIRDIRITGEEIDPVSKRINKTMCVQIDFDNLANTNRWFKLKTKASDVLANIGNRTAAFEAGERVEYKYPPTGFFEGEASIIDDERENFYKDYQKNKSTCVVDVFSNLANKTVPSGL